MKQHIESLMQVALKRLQEQEALPAIPAFIQIEACKDRNHGDYSSNIAMVIAKITQIPPQAIAERLVSMIPPSPLIEKYAVAERGFINIFLSNVALHQTLNAILQQKETYGRSKMGRGKRILIEFVSKPPLGPLTIEAGRHATIGNAVANLLDAVGFKTYREYYIHDEGPQMDLLALSIWLRYLEICGESLSYPEEAYQHAEISHIAHQLYAQHQNHFQLNAGAIHAGSIELLIQQTKTLLQDRFSVLFEEAENHMLADIREDLSEFGVRFDNWFSERHFMSSHLLEGYLKRLTPFLYEQTAGLCFAGTRFGDCTDRLIKDRTGHYTYFARDIAYHLHKFDRGFDIAMDVFDVDDQTYLLGLKAALKAAEIDPERLIPLWVQHVHINSTALADACTLRTLRTTLGNDPARFCFTLRNSTHPIEAAALTEDNVGAVHYIQYAHARCCSVFHQLTQQNKIYNEAQGLLNLSQLSQVEERQLLNTLSRYPDMIIDAALKYEPQGLAHYLRQLATDFHTYYNAHHFLVEDETMCQARLVLIAATRQVLSNGLHLLGITAPEHM